MNGVSLRMGDEKTLLEKGKIMDKGLRSMPVAIFMNMPMREEQ